MTRPKQNESTLCTYTECGNEIKEGDILGYGDNYPCVVFYNRHEAKFEAIEFGYEDEGYSYRTHELICYTTKWKIIGNINKDSSQLKDMPKDFDYNEDVNDPSTA